MKTGRRLLGLLSIPAGAITSHVLYARAEDGNLWNLDLFVMMLIASVVAFVVVTGTRFVLATQKQQFIVGSAAAYVALLLLVLVRALVHGDGALAEAVMWLPIIMIFGVLFMAPTIALVWCGSFLAIRITDRKPEQHAGQVSSEAAPSASSDEPSA